MIAQNNSFGRKLFEDIELAIKFRELDVRYANPKTKIVALLRAAGWESREIFQSVEFDIRLIAYEEVLNLLL